MWRRSSLWNTDEAEQKSESRDQKGMAFFICKKITPDSGLQTANVMSLVDASVNEYQRRGFKNLMVSFGCTGGQHRSVYLAEQLAKRLRDRSGVDVRLHHRELEKPAQ